MYHTSLVRAMGQVLVHGPWLALCAADWNTSRSGVLKKGFTARETLVKFRQSPWCNDLDLGLQSIECKLETDLVVALSGATVTNSEAALLLCNGNLGSGDDWASQRGTQEVDVLVDGIALDSREAELLDKLLPQILNVACNSTNLQCLCLGSLEVLCIAPTSVLSCISRSTMSSFAYLLDRHRPCSRQLGIN
jgi:hypothetical protein